MSGRLIEVVVWAGLTVIEILRKIEELIIEIKTLKRYSLIWMYSMKILSLYNTWYLLNKLKTANKIPLVLIYNHNLPNVKDSVTRNWIILHINQNYNQSSKSSQVYVINEINSKELYIICKLKTASQIYYRSVF